MSLSLSSSSTEFLHRRHSRRNSSSPGGHDLFISSTQTTLNSHLVNYFSNSDINPYCVQINAGGEEEQIRENLRQAIDESKMYVVVFSEDFPDSEACLWELETIVEAAKEGGKKILAIFYGVTRDDVRLQTDLYAVKLSKHEATESTVERWMESLRYVAADQNDDGLSLTANTIGDDADLCQQTLERVHQLMIGLKEPSVHLQLILRGLPNFVSTQSLEVFLASSKSSLCLEDCNTLDSVFSQPGRKQLEQLRVRRCPMLTEIPCLGELESLKVLIIEDCMSLMRLPNLSKLVLLEVLYITLCPSLTEVLGLSNLESLSSMEISNCYNIHYVDITLLKLTKLESFLLKNCGNLRRLGDDGLSFQNLQSPSSEQQTINNIYGRTLLGRSERNDWDNDDENFQLSETSSTPTQSAFVVASDHGALGRNHHYPVFYTGSTSTTANTNEQEIFKEQRCDDSFTNIVVASRSIDVFPYWYPDSGATNHLINNTSTMVDSAPYQGTGKAIVDHEEYTTTISNEDCINHQLVASSDFITEKYNPEHAKEQQETLDEQDTSWIFIDRMNTYPSKEEAMAVLRHFFSSGIEMAADDDHMTSVAAAIHLLLSDKVISQGDAWKRFSRNVRMAYYYCMSIKEEAGDDDEAKLHEALLLEASQSQANKMIGDNQQPLAAKMEADYVTLLKANKNELHAQDFERAAGISQEWLLLVKQHWDLLAVAHL